MVISISQSNQNSLSRQKSHRNI